MSRSALVRLACRGLAVLLAVGMLGLLGRNLVLVAMLRQAPVRDAVTVPRERGGEALVWWGGERRFLRRADFTAMEVYALPGDGVLPDVLDEALQAVDEPDGREAAWEELRQFLEPFRIPTVAALGELSPKAWNGRFVVLEQREARLAGVHEEPLVPLSRETASRARASALFSELFILLCGSMGSVLLWRHGATSSPARWLAAGLAWSAGMPASLVKDTFQSDAWLAWLSGPVRGLLQVALFPADVLAGFSGLVIVAWVGLWIRLCWPQAAAGLRGWAVFGAKACGVLLVWMALGLIFFVFGAALYGGNSPGMWGAGMLGSGLALILGGALVRKWTTQDPVLGLRAFLGFSGLAFAWSLATVILMAEEPIPASWLRVGLASLGLLLYAGAAMALSSAGRRTAADAVEGRL